MEQKQVVGLTTALAARLRRDEYLAAGSILAANAAGTPSSITISPNGLLVYTPTGFQSLALTAETVVARGATGDIAALSFSAFKTALNIGGGDLTLADRKSVV